MIISIVRRSLMTRSVCQNIDFQSITREEFINRHVTDFADALYNPDPNVRKAIAISDGTYSYIEKSGNYRALRQSFSVHKGRHLVKPVLITGPDGYILEIQGPYFADGRNNDAEILRNEMEQDKYNIREWFEPGDIFLVDRGYRDVLPYLEDLGFTCKMPACLVGNQKQLTTQQANESRIVTMQRWVIEARNGHFKTIFKFFDGIIPRAHVLHLRDFYLLAGAFLNRFHGPLIMEGKTPELARVFLNKVLDVNVIQARVEQELLARRNTMWVRLDANQVNDFPNFDFDYLKRITTGTYQLGLAPSYVQDKLDHDGTEIFELDAHRTEPGFIRIRVYKERYISFTKYIENSSIKLRFIDSLFKGGRSTLPGIASKK